jgi:hypothetical protein
MGTAWAPCAERDMSPLPFWIFSRYPIIREEAASTRAQAVRKAEPVRKAPSYTSHYLSPWHGLASMVPRPRSWRGVPAHSALVAGRF